MAKKKAKKAAPKAKAKPAKAAKAKAKPAKKPAAKAAPAKAAKPVRDKALPDGSAWVIPYMAVKDVRASIEFYKKAFGMQERTAIETPDGRIMHAEIIHEGHVIMLGPEDAEMDTKGPLTLGGSPVGIMIYVRKVDEFYTRAIAAGAKSIMAPEDQFWGDRSCYLLDPEGHKWFCAQHVRDVSPKDMEKAMASMHEGGDEGGEEHGHDHAAAHSHEHSHGGEPHSHEHDHDGHAHDDPHAHDHSHEGHAHEDHSHEGHSHEGHTHEGHSHEH